MTLLLGFGAVNTGNNLLYLLVSALLGFMAVSGLLGKSNLGRPRVQLILPAEIYAGLPAPVRVRLHNDRRRPVFLLQVELLGERATFKVVGGGETAEEELTLHFPNRGRQIIGQARLSSIFPVNFFVRGRTIKLNLPTVVFPAPRPCRPLAPADEHPRPGEALAAGKGQQGEISRIGDYRGGEPLKQIHWKLSARGDQLLVKELAATAALPVLLDLDNLPGHSLEERLSGATFLVNRYLRQNRPVGLRLGRRLIRPATTRSHRLHLLTELGTYGQG
ncbi:DUF58 domain-containing protein [Trichloromonas sp.]|uniref:DUF58 domain-containing protein n=1 Tax=Trichloromonas sp. TaxID=3069249 RepID=UPI003D819819